MDNIHKIILRDISENTLDSSINKHKILNKIYKSNTYKIVKLIILKYLENIDDIILSIIYIPIISDSSNCSGVNIRKKCNNKTIFELGYIRDTNRYCALCLKEIMSIIKIISQWIYDDIFDKYIIFKETNVLDDVSNIIINDLIQLR